MPVIRTSAPGRSLPSARASASASGIEPDDVGEGSAQCRRQRQAPGKGGDVLQQQAVGIEFAAPVGARRPAHQAQPHIERRRRVALRRLEAHAGERDLAVAALGRAVVAQRDAPARAGQQQRREIGRQAQIDLGQRDVGDHAFRAQLVEVEPYAQCALRLGQGDLLRQQRHHALQGRQVGVIDRCIQATAPVGDATRHAELRRAEVHAHVDRGGERRRRPRLQRELA